MIVMPSNASGWFWHSLARETGRIGHLYSPGAQRGPWSWFPYALDNGAFSCWEPTANKPKRKRSYGPAVLDRASGTLLLGVEPTSPVSKPTFNDERWAATEQKWHRLIAWAQIAPIKPLWAIVPDVPGEAVRTFERWAQYAPGIRDVPLALAVQDGMTVEQVRALSPAPTVIAVGGSTEWKWATVEMWAKAFPRVHLLRCNSPTKLYELEEMGVESCDGTGWNRGDRKQTAGLEDWARQWSKQRPHLSSLWPYVCRSAREPKQESFA